MEGLENHEQLVCTNHDFVTPTPPSIHIHNAIAMGQFL